VKHTAREREVIPKKTSFTFFTFVRVLHWIERRRFLQIQIFTCQRNLLSSGNGRTPLPAPPPDSPLSPSCIPSTLSELGFKVLSLFFCFSYRPYFSIQFSKLYLIDFAVNDGRASHLPSYKNTAHAIFTITRIEVRAFLHFNFNNHQITCFCSYITIFWCF